MVNEVSPSPRITIKISEPFRTIPSRPGGNSFGVRPKGGSGFGLLGLFRFRYIECKGIDGSLISGEFGVTITGNADGIGTSNWKSSGNFWAASIVVVRETVWQVFNLVTFCTVYLTVKTKTERKYLFIYLLESYYFTILFLTHLCLGSFI